MLKSKFKKFKVENDDRARARMYACVVHSWVGILFHNRRLTQAKSVFGTCRAILPDRISQKMHLFPKQRRVVKA